MDYGQFYKGFISQLRIYCALPGNSQVQVAGNLDMKAQSLNDILNISKGINSKTQFDLYCEMGAYHTQIFKTD